MQSLPKLLTSLRSDKGSKVMEVMMKVIQKVGVQGHHAFLRSLQENSVALLGELKCFGLLKLKVKFKLLHLIYRSELRSSAHLQQFTTINFPARNPPENSANLGVSILSGKLSPHGVQDRQSSSFECHILFSDIGLVPFLHLGMVRL